MISLPQKCGAECQPPFPPALQENQSSLKHREILEKPEDGPKAEFFKSCFL